MVRDAGRPNGRDQVAVAGRGDSDKFRQKSLMFGPNSPNFIASAAAAERLNG
jgi:hypothetical protein